MMIRTTPRRAAFALVFGFGVSAAPAQEPPGPGDGQGTLLTPQVNVRAGSVAARAPGRWVQMGIAEHAEFNNAAFRRSPPMVGEIQPKTPSVRDQVKLDILVSLFDLFNQLLTALQLVLGAPTATTTAPAS